MHADALIHETAIVDDGAVIGQGTRIWHWTHICRGAKIGANCILGQNVFVGSGVIIGNNVKIQNNVSIYDSVIIEDDVFCGPSIVFTNVINPRSYISRKHEYLSTKVKRGVTLGANATILCGNTLGEYSFIGAGAVITSDVMPYSLMIGVPARPVGWVCICGLKINFSSQSNACCDCGREYLLDNDRCIIKETKN